MEMRLWPKTKIQLHWKSVMEYACNDATEWKQTVASQLTQGGLNGRRERSRRESTIRHDPQRIDLSVT